MATSDLDDLRLIFNKKCRKLNRRKSVHAIILKTHGELTKIQTEINFRFNSVFTIKTKWIILVGIILSFLAWGLKDLRRRWKYTCSSRGF